MPVRRRLAAIATLASLGGLATGALAAAPSPLTKVSLELAAGWVAPSVVRGSLHAEAHGGSSTAPANVSPLEVTVPGEATLSLTPGIVWELRLEAPGLWAAPVLVSPEAGNSPAHMILFPLAMAESAVSVPRGETLPSSLAVRFQAPPTERSAAGRPGLAPRGSIDCPLAASGRLRCRLPAGALDLRLAAPDFVPVYLWGVSLSAAQTTLLGPVRLIRGGSIAGWLTTHGGIPPDWRQATVGATPRAAARLVEPGAKERIGDRSQVAVVNSRGFFQVGGVPPGSYMLTAILPGVGVGHSPPVDVAAGGESILREPVLLRPPADLDVVIDPAADPYGEAWRLELYQRDTLSGGLEESAGPAQPLATGRWRWRRLDPGDYHLFVGSVAGSRWASQEITVEPGMEPVEIEVPAVRIRGDIRQGGDPVATTLWFGGANAARKIRIDTDDRGEIDGFLPEEGKWPVEMEDPASRQFQALEAVEVHERPGKGYAEVHIVLPDTSLSGQVVSAAGEPVPGALLLLVNFRDHRREAMANADSEGRFSLHGLATGSRFLSADAGERGESEWLPVRIETDRAVTGLRLVVQRKRELSGTVRSLEVPVPGAWVSALPGSALSATPIVEAVSGADGTFELRLPAGTANLDLLVAPPGLPARLAHATLDESVKSLDLAVAPEGGALSLEAPGKEQERPFATGKLLVHGGAAIPSYLLLRVPGAVTSEDAGIDRLTLPLVEPGSYIFCGVSGPPAVPDQVMALPPAEHCTSGVLSPSGELTLRLGDDGSKGDAP